MPEKVDHLYEYLADEEDARVCTEISESACHVVPGNFFLILIAQFFTKLGDALTSTKVVLPWLMNSVGAPVFLSGLLVPVRESGSLIPQLVVGGVIRRFAIRKPFFVTGCILQGTSVAGMGWAALVLSGITAGLVIIGLLIVFSLARGICSVASKDVLGKTIPKQRRGRLTGYSASAAGLISIGVGVVLMLDINLQQSSYLLLFAGTGCWLLAALHYALIKEYAGATEGGGNALQQGVNRLKLLKTDIPFRRFVLVRCLLMSSGLSAPYFIMLAQTLGKDSSLLNLGIFIAIGGFASFISGGMWGKLADRSSRKVLLLTAAMTAILCLAGGLTSYLQPTGSLWILMLLFLLISVTHQGVRLGRKTYLVDLAKGNKRTDYVAVSNSLIGIMLLFVGAMGAVMAHFSLALAFIVFALTSGLALLIGRYLPEA
ncbi:MFS transporter [Neptunicella sp. SCSIO 80796]|uniref:MFS transporter n=1 Tax=Neptunicella plasticusilytica TaxID=3117012 RepID=UPI003A4E3FEB